MTKKTGNVKADASKPPKEAYPAPEEKLQSGDIVRMTPQALKNQTWAKTSPRVLISNGWPNEFHVTEAFEHKTDGPCVELQECCFLRHNPNGEYSCGGHPMGFFEKVKDGSPEREFQPGDSRASVTLPLFGQLLGYEYRADEKKAIFKVAGQEMEATGGLADYLNNIIKKHGVV